MINMDKEVKKEVKRPLALKLIIVFLILEVILFIIIKLIGGFAFVGLLFILALYYGLWEMKRDWMYLLIFGMVISVIVSIYGFFIEIGIVGIFSLIDLGIAFLNIFSIGWLFNNRNLFEKSESKGSFWGTKKEWLIILLIIAIIFVSLFLLFYLSLK